LYQVTKTVFKRAVRSLNARAQHRTAVWR